MNCKKITLLLVAILLGLITACRTAPIAERDAAKSNIEKAKLVNATEYASDELGIAEEQFGIGEENIVEEKKSGKNKTAFSAFTMADEEAKKAYQKSLPPYITNKVNSFEVKLTESATTNFLDRKSPTQFVEAETNLLKAVEELEKASYDAAMAELQEGDTNYDQAISNAQYYEEELSRIQDTIEALIKNAEQQKAANATPSLYGDTLAQNDKIMDATEEGFYEEALEAQVTLIASLEEMLIVIEEKRRESANELSLANEKISSAEKIVSKSQNQETSNDNN